MKQLRNSHSTKHVCRPNPSALIMRVCFKALKGFECGYFFKTILFLFGQMKTSSY